MHNERSAHCGHWPTLLACFLHFDVSFSLWVLLGALGIYIAESAHLSPAEKGLLVAIPILSGSLLRVPLGLLSDRVGGKRVGMAILAFLFLPLTLGWLAGEGLSSLLAIGLMLGTAGASFAVALPLASRWYPPQRQGLVMGIAAAGNSGTVMTNLFAPPLANWYGWHNVLGLAMIPLGLTLIAFTLLAKDSPAHAKGQPLGRYLRALRQPDLWWFCCLYAVTFGGYVGLSSFLPLFFRDQFQVSALVAGQLTALAAFVGSLLRPLGGYLADKRGGVRVLSWLLLCIGLGYLLCAQRPALTVMAALIVGVMACSGMANGAVFQLVPQRFREEIGIATGVVGAIGGCGGFLLPNLLGQAKQITGSFAYGFILLGAVAVSVLLLLRILAGWQDGWRLSWRAPGAIEAFEEG